MIVINVDKECFNSKSGIRQCFHYTSVDALISIMENASLRFTHYGFLNDSEEYNYIFDLLEDEELKNCEFYGFIKRIFEEVGKDNSGLIYLNRKSKPGGFYNLVTGDYYIFSASTVSDSLPMWSYYSKNEGYYGYAVKFDIGEMARALQSEDGKFLYGRVIYDRKEQIKTLIRKAKEITDRLNHQLSENKKDEPYIDEAQSEFYEFVQIVRIFFKRQEFKHESEIRIVLLANPSEQLKAGFGSVNGLIRPYIEFSFKDRLPIKGIKISPSIDYESGRKGLEYILRETGCISFYSHIDIEDDKFISKSKIKLRY